MRICLIPLATEPRNPAVNLQQLVMRLDQVKKKQPDLICLPECSLTGYLSEEVDFLHFAEPIPGPTTVEMSRLASSYHAYLCFGMLESTAQGVYNTAILLDRNGAVAGIHRKIAEKPPFVNGSQVRGVKTDLGQLGMLVCADLFSDEVVTRLDPALQLLLMPMSRSFDGQSPDCSRWEKEEKQVYLEAVRHVGIPVVIVNALETNLTDASFGGALVVNARGQLLAESPHATDEILITDLNLDNFGHCS